jgi:hypothetical protein
MRRSLFNLLNDKILTYPGLSVRSLIKLESQTNLLISPYTR